ncbi:glycosyltransferase family 4 protein [Marinomonas algarum]|uniref:Glycosyltransferase n=1 Tax=Marinomonas algarum TaxID=2883105 RepID=A0A9X1ILN8_9GAMM|nr:glycosyltransferase [Marinomonas algarum]MCB5161510.1 glycosyltransferase [Marinomonas algarum]
MKVLHIITGLNDGGAEAVLFRLATSNESKFEHLVISLMDAGKYGSMLEDFGVKVYCLNMSNGILGLLNVFRIFSIVRKVKPDVVQTWMFHGDLFGGVLSRLAGVKNIVWGVHHTTLIKGESKRSTILIAKINSLLSRFIPKKIIYCADRSREVQESIGFYKKKGMVVSNGYDVSEYVANEKLGEDFKKELKLHSELLIGHVARFDPQKDQNNLFVGLSLLNIQSFKAILIGTNLDDDNSLLVKKKTELELKDSVKLIGRRNDIPSAMNAIDVFVLSSSFGEAFPNVLNEAMACGTPCITTDVGDASRIVGDTGWVVPPKDPQALSDAIMEAYHEMKSSPEKWAARKQACRNRIVDNFSLETMVSGYERVWLEGIEIT